MVTEGAPINIPHEKTGKGENGCKTASQGFVVMLSENSESTLSLVSCPSSPSEIIEETAESDSNDKTLPHEERSEVPDGRGSEVTGGKDERMFLHKPLRNGKQLTQGQPAFTHLQFWHLHWHYTRQKINR